MNLIPIREYFFIHDKVEDENGSVTGPLGNFKGRNVQRMRDPRLFKCAADVYNHYGYSQMVMQGEHTFFYAMVMLGARGASMTSVQRSRLATILDRAKKIALREGWLEENKYSGWVPCPKCSVMTPLEAMFVAETMCKQCWEKTVEKGFVKDCK